MLRAMRQRARYSPEQRSWTIPGWETKIIALEHLIQLPAWNSFEDFLCEGIRRGLWDMGVDAKTGMDVIHIK